MEEKDIFESLLEKLKKQTKSELVFGEPVEKGHKIVIPVARVMAGVHTGHPLCAKWFCKNEDEENTDENQENSKGAGFIAKPIGVVEITEEKTVFIPITDIKRTVGIFLLGALFGVLFLKRRPKRIRIKK